MRAVLWVTAAVLIVIGAGVGGLAAAGSTRAPTKHFSDRYIRFDYPASWQATSYQENGEEFSSIVFLSNEATHSPCVSAPGRLSCSSNVIGSLRLDGILVHWTLDAALPGNTVFSAPGNTFDLDGHKAREVVLQRQVDCPKNSREEIMVYVEDLARGAFLTMDACLAPPNPSPALASLQAMISSVRIPPVPQ